MPQRRPALLALFALLAAASLQEVAGGPAAVAGVPNVPNSMIETIIAEPPKPNVVVMMVDDMRADDLRYMPRTTRLLGSAGVTFENSFAPYPLCCPARSSFLLGQYAHNHKVWSHREPYGFQVLKDDSTVATWLQDAGYATVFVGKYLNGYGSQPAPDGSAETSVHYIPPGWTDWRASIDGGLPAGHPDNGGTYRYWDTTLTDNGDGFQAFPGRYQSRVYGELSEQIIAERAAADQPFFYWVNYTAPHHGGPRESDDPSLTKADGTVWEMPTPAVPPWARGRFDDVITTAPGAAGDPDPSDAPKFLQGLTVPSDWERPLMLEATRQRAEALSVVDAQVGRTVRALEASGELANTIVMFTSDNGYFLGEHRLIDKTELYEESARVPLIVRGPGIPRGARRRQITANIDLAPTILDVTGAQPRRTMDGRSLVPLARFPSTDADRDILLENQRSVAVRTQDHLYAEHPFGEAELYDLAADPFQLESRHDDPALALTRATLEQRLRELEDCAGASCR